VSRTMKTLRVAYILGVEERVLAEGLKTNLDGTAASDSQLRSRARPVLFRARGGVAIVIEELGALGQRSRAG
jgi:hypothetical protein